MNAQKIGSLLSDLFKSHREGQFVDLDELTSSLRDLVSKKGELYGLTEPQLRSVIYNAKTEFGVRNYTTESLIDRIVALGRAEVTDELHLASNEAGIRNQFRIHDQVNTQINTQHHINKALGWIGAAMMTLGALSSARTIVSKDEQDKTKINFTPLMWTLLQGTMAAGILYLTVKQPQATQTALR
ncbi:MAG: hypothetical protein ACK52W_08920 [Alphaproteobacteria bacterium]